MAFLNPRYANDVPRSVRFYEDTFEFLVIRNLGERGCAVHAGIRQILPLFKNEAPRNKIASRRGLRVTRRVRYPICRIGQLGIVAPYERNRSRRESDVGVGRL
jgi:hypothetical protein